MTHRRQYTLLQKKKCQHHHHMKQQTTISCFIWKANDTDTQTGLRVIVIPIGICRYSGVWAVNIGICPQFPNYGPPCLALSLSFTLNIGCILVSMYTQTFYARSIRNQPLILITCCIALSSENPIRNDYRHSLNGLNRSLSLCMQEPTHMNRTELNWTEVNGIQH